MDINKLIIHNILLEVYYLRIYPVKILIEKKICNKT